MGGPPDVFWSSSGCRGLAGASGGVGAMARLSEEALAAWVAASCEESGVPVFVTDPRVLRQVAVAVGGCGWGGAQARQRGRSPPAPPTGST